MVTLCVIAVLLMKLSERSVFQKQDMIFLRFGATIAFQVRYQGIKGL